MSAGTPNRGSSRRTGTSSNAQRLQSLRDSSEQDVPSSRPQSGAIGEPRSDTMRTSTAIPPALQALLATGPTTVLVTAEREHPNANPHKPNFLKGVTFDGTNPDLWYKHVLPYVEGLTFNVNSNADIDFVGAMFTSPHLPQLFVAVTKLEVPQFYWYSGVTANRPHNPYLQMAKNFPRLHTFTFRMHTASITTSAFNERRMIEIEEYDLERSKERKCIPWQDVTYKYEMIALLACTSLERIRIEYLECEMTTHFTKNGSPMRVLRFIQGWLKEGFERQGQRVDVAIVPAV